MNRIRRIAFLSAIAFSTLSATSLTVGVDNSANAYPFGTPGSGSGTVYQEAYSSTLFSGPIVISGIDFFLQPGFVNIGDDGVIRSATYTLSLSTITAGVNSLSDSNFSANLGANNTVFDSVALSGTSPNELVFTGGPFDYDPSEGNLLLNISITNVSGAPAGGFFEDGGGSGPATIARYTNFGNGTSGFGLVTEFDSAAPEPGSSMLLLIGLVTLAVCAWVAKATSLSGLRQCRNCQR